VEFPDDLKYAEEHEWLRLDGATGTVGITDYAQRELTDVVFVELPKPNAEVKKGEPFGTIEAIKAVSELYSPVDGTVIEVNEELSTAPELVNTDPYGKGWMIRIAVKAPSQAEDLLSAADYRALVESA